MKLEKAVEAFVFNLLIIRLHFVIFVSNQVPIMASLVKSIDCNAWYEVMKINYKEQRT